MPTVLSVGEATLDAFIFLNKENAHVALHEQHQEIHLSYAEKIAIERVEFTIGGNAANTATSFSRLGLHSQIFSMVGDDNVGDQIVESLKKEKIDQKYVQIYRGPTSYTTALVFKGERTLLIHHVPHDYNLPNFETVDWVYLTSLGAAYQGAYEKVLTYIKKNQIKMSFNPGTYQLKGGVDKLKPFLAATEILFLNKEESQLLTELSAKATFRELSEALYDLGPKTVVITDGPNGAYVFDGHQLLFCDIFPIEIVERTGAGDSFGAGFTAAVIHGQDIAEAMRWGMANASGVVNKVGPQAGLLKIDEMHEILGQFEHIQPKVVRG